MSSNRPVPAGFPTGEVAEVCRRLLPDFEPVASEPAAPQSTASRSVFRVTDRRSRHILLKLFPDDGRRGDGADALATEAATLRHLHRLGCPVPKLLAADSTVGAIAIEWLPGETLESRLQGGAISRDERRAVVRSLDAVNTAFRGITGTAGRERRDRIEKEMKSRLRKEISDLEVGPPWFVRSGDASLWSQALDDAFERMIEGEWGHGSLDCSASNIILARGKVYIIDLSILGAEWCERRVARYCIATGAGRPGGRYESLFDVETAGYYSVRVGGANSRTAVVARLDLHHLLILLQALNRSGDRETRQRGQMPGAGRAKSAGPDGRAEELLALALRPLAPNSVADSLRYLLSLSTLE